MLVGEKRCSTESIDLRPCLRVMCFCRQAQTCDGVTQMSQSLYYKFVAVRQEGFLSSSNFLAQAAQQSFLFQGAGW
jgi:hypothetical protein